MWRTVRKIISPPMASAATGPAMRPPTPSVWAVKTVAPVETRPASAPETADLTQAQRIADAARACGVSAEADERVAAAARATLRLR